MGSVGNRKPIKLVGRKFLPNRNRAQLLSDWLRNDSTCVE